MSFQFDSFNFLNALSFSRPYVGDNVLHHPYCMCIIARHIISGLILISEQSFFGGYNVETTQGSAQKRINKNFVSVKMSVNWNIPTSHEKLNQLKQQAAISGLCSMKLLIEGIVVKQATEDADTIMVKEALTQHWITDLCSKEALTYSPPFCNFLTESFTMTEHQQNQS